MIVDVWVLEFISEALGLFLITFSPKRVVFSLTFPLLTWKYSSGGSREPVTNH